MKSFEGFSPKALTFFRQLAKNNSREWFAPRKEEYQQLVYRPMIEAVSAVNDGLRKFAVHYVTEPKKAIYRLYRDTRFSKDKTPYKSHLGATFHHRKFGKNNAAGLYFSISDKEVEVAGGMYMPGPEEWLAVRSAIARDVGSFEKIIHAKALRRLFGVPHGRQLTRVPKHFDADAPGTDYLRYTQFYFYTMLDPKVATTPTLVKEVVARFRVLLPLTEYLNNAALAARATEQTDERPLRPSPMF